MINFMILVIMIDNNSNINYKNDKIQIYTSKGDDEVITCVNNKNLVLLKNSLQRIKILKSKLH